jgi:hypothetical protein
MLVVAWLGTQDTVLFNDTIGYNISYGKPEEDEEAMHRAAMAARIHEPITERFPKVGDCDRPVVLTFQLVSFRVKPCRVTLRHVSLNRIILRHVLPCYIVSCRV